MERNGPEVVENEQTDDKLRRGLTTHDFGVESEALVQFDLFSSCTAPILLVLNLCSAYCLYQGW